MYLKKKRIFFRVDGDHGKFHGLGHVTRILKLYNDLKFKYHSKYNFFFITKKNTLGHYIIKQQTKEKIYFLDKAISKNFFLSDDKVIVDTLGIEKKFSSFLRNSNVKKIISFDELNPNFYNRGIIINGIYFTKRKLVARNKLNVYQNIDYITLDKNFKFKKKLIINNKILITSGGTDKKNFLFKISKLLLKYFENKYILHVIIGAGVKKNNKIFKLKKYKNIKFIKNANNLKKFYDKCSFCITSGGNVMFEAISSGRATFSAETYRNQEHAIKYFKRKGLIFYIGKTNKIKTHVILNNFERLNKNKKKLKEIYRINTKAIDGKGYERVFKIIDNYIKF